MKGVRNWGAIAAHLRPGAGSHGGGKKRKNRQERKATRLTLRKEVHD